MECFKGILSHSAFRLSRNYAMAILILGCRLYRLHRESINQVEWVYWDIFDSFQAMSSSADGSVVIWKVSVAVVLQVL